MKQQYSREIGLRENFIASFFSKQANRFQPKEYSLNRGFPGPFPNLVFDFKDTVAGHLVNLCDIDTQPPVTVELPYNFPFEARKTKLAHDLNESDIPREFANKDI